MRCGGNRCDDGRMGGQMHRDGEWCDVSTCHCDTGSRLSSSGCCTILTALSWFFVREVVLCYRAVFRAQSDAGKLLLCCGPLVCRTVVERGCGSVRGKYGE